MGRPKLAAGKARNAIVGLRFQPEEKKQMEREAKRRGISLSSYLKEKLQAS